MTNPTMIHGAPPREPLPTPSGRGGFSIVELVVAIVILAIGMVGLAGTTALVIRQVTFADVNTERSAALQSTIERIRATPYADVGDGGTTEGAFDIAWTVVESTGQTRTIQVVTTGPGMRRTGDAVPMLASNVQDTFSFVVLSP